MKIHRGFRPLPESSPIALCSSYRGRVVLTEDPTKVTCNRCRSITGDLPATKGRVLRDGSPAPFCFIPQDCKGEIPVALTEEQRSFLLSLDPHCLTPGERRALRKKWADDGCRLTDCCGSYSTFHDFYLVCRACWECVGFGEGDGTEWADGKKRGENVVVQIRED